MSYHHEVHLIRSDRGALESATAFADTIAADAPLRDRTRRLPVDEIERLSRTGLLGITVPRAFGGAGVSAATPAEIVAIIAAADASIGQTLQNHFYMVEAIRLTVGRPGSGSGSTASWRGQGSATLWPRFAPGHTAVFAPPCWQTETVFASTAKNSIRWAGCSPTGSPLSPRTRRGRERLHSRRAMRRDSSSSMIGPPSANVSPAAARPSSTACACPRTRSSHTISPSPGRRRWGALAQIIHTAVDLGVARAAIAALDNVRSSGPALIGTAGELFIARQAAEAMIARAGALVDRASADATVASVAEASIAVAETQFLLTEIALRATNMVFDLLGPAATKSETGLDRHWRDARTHTLHDPARWKLHAIGHWALNGKPPPRHGAI